MEPRNYRQKEFHEIAARPITEEHLRDASEYRHPVADTRNGSHRLKRILISLAALLLMAAVSGGLIYYLSNNGTEIPGLSRTKPILPDEPAPKPPDSLDRPREQSVAPVAPTAPAPPVEASGPQPAPEPPTPAIVPKIPAGVAAAEVLEKFLAAGSLAERLPIIETTLDPKELENTVLAGALPPDPRFSADIQEANRAGNWTDIYFNVELKDAAGKYQPYLVLLRAHGEEQPKVVVGPFLDTYGGRLAAFASTPTDKAAIFQVVASAVAKTTSDQKVPNHEQKLWLKLLPRDNEKEITGAFFTKGSPIGNMLTNDASGFRYGQAKPVKVQIRWNTEEDPKMPYLEAVDIKELRWSP